MIDLPCRTTYACFFFCAHESDQNVVQKHLSFSSIKTKSVLKDSKLVFFETEMSENLKILTCSTLGNLYLKFFCKKNFT